MHPRMYICICKAVTEHHIHQEIRSGAATMRDLSQRLGVATQCGSCGKCARALLAEYRAGLEDQQSPARC